jgi:hypothetical protein
MARLRRTILEREKQQSVLRDEFAAIARKINAPIFDVLKSDPRSKEGLKALQKLRRNRKPSLPALPKAPKFQSGIGTGSIYSYLGQPYFHWAIGDHAQLAQAEPDGNLHGIVHPNGGGGWVWCGVGLAFRPLFANTLVAIQPIMPYAFHWWGIGSWGFTAHTEGSLGVYVYEYDLSWSFRRSETFRTPIWKHTTETGYSESGSATKSDRIALFMRSDSNYMVWATLEIYCNDSKGSWFGSSDAYGEMQAQCPVIVFAQFPH